MEKTKKSCAVILLCIICLFITGCNIDVQVGGAQELIDDWMEYKRQVESTQILAENVEQDAQSEQSQSEETQNQNAQQADGEEQDGESTEKTDVTSGNTVSAGNTPDNQQDVSHGFYYSYLSDSMRVVYQEIYQSLLTRQETEISTLNQEHVDLAFQCVLYDHPEIFYVSGYHITKRTMDDKVIGISMVGEYEKTKEEVVNCRKQIDTYVNACISAMPQGLDDYGKVKYVFDYLVTNTKYNLNALDNQNICSVFIGGESVCQGYAEAVQYLLAGLGMEATVVPGSVTGGGRHAWNLVKVNGSYYYMDATWGDVNYRDTGNVNQDTQQKSTPINYDYFLVTTEQLEKTHVIDSPLPMPACISKQDNYYIREGLYFESVDEARLATVFENAYANNMQNVTIKCADANVFAVMKEYLLTEQAIFQYVDALDTVSYSEDEQMYTLCFWM